MSFAPGPALVRRDGKPAAATLLVADRCNQACDHCYQVQGTRGELALDGIEAVLAELASVGVLFLSLSGGEATLRADLPEILRAARRHRFAISLITNGLAISDELLDAIVETGLRAVSVTVYSDCASDHDAITRVPGSFARTCDSIARLAARGVRVELGIPLTSACTASREALEAFAAKLGCSAVISPWVTAREDGSTAPLARAASAAQLHDYFGHASAPRVQDTDRRARLDDHPCGACASLAVASDGTVRPCTDVPRVLANAAHPGSLQALADSEDYQLLANVRWRDVHGCRDCDLMPWCSRCHGSAMKEAGDLLGPQPEACRVAVARYEAQVGPLIRLAEGSGPFALPGRGRLQRIEDRLTAADASLPARFAWTNVGNASGAARLLPADRLARPAGAAPSVARNDFQR